MKHPASLVALAFLVAGCGGPGSHASASPKATSSPTAPATTSTVASPAPITGAFAVLATPMSADTYTVAIVGIDGKVVASAQASSPTSVTCGDASAAVLPLPISTSDDRAYYMDAQGVVRFLTVQGETGRATTVPVGGGRRSMFAVSPDDQRIAVIVSDFTSSGASIKLYVEDLNGGTNHIDIYSQSNAFSLWPMGWHGTDNLVVGKIAACTQGGGPLSGWPLELHVVDPATAVRRYTLGGPTCVIVGSPTLAGALCQDTTNADYRVISWTGGILRTFPFANLARAYLSPDGSSIVVVGTGVTNIFPGGNAKQLEACGWIDSTHVIGGGTTPRIWDITKTTLIPVNAKGTCAGRIPGSL